MKVMLSAAASPVAPGIIAHLRSLGHYVVGHDRQRDGYGASVCDEFHLSPPASEQRAYMAFLEGMDCDIYLPFLNEELMMFAAWGAPVPALISPERELRVFTRKVAQQKVLHAADLPVAPRAFDGDAIIKPDLGRGGKGVFRTDNRQVIDALTLDANDHVAQRFIEGKEYTIDVLCDLDGMFVAAVPRLRMQASGVSVVGRIDMDPDLLALAGRVVIAFSFRGPINIQAIVGREGTFITEINPRLSGSCMFTVLAGFDILQGAIDVFFGKRAKIGAVRDGMVIRRHYVEEIA